MLKIGLCDDNTLYLNELTKIISDITSINNIDIEITSFSNGEDLIKFSKDHENYFDILFLDILMDGINGINTARRLRKLSSDVNIIFVTCSKEYALDSYSVNACGYILKPFSKNSIRDKVLELYDKIELSRKNVICVKNNQDIYSIKLDNVIYFESNLRKITAHMKNGEKICFYNKISNLEEEIKNSLFLRCHRSFLVNLMYIKNIVSSDLKTTTNEILPISKKYLTSSRDIFTNYIRVKLSTSSDS
ncbi:MAG: LytR/AlgR family response regulator transcription factor [Clostridium sp.]